MRADKFFAEKFGSRTKAAEAIERGWVLINGKTVRPKDDVCETDAITFVESGSRFVSNGGYKLERALQTFSVDVQGLRFVDIGASNGGFTDCLLQNGAEHVYAVDVGESQLDKTLAENPKITVMDRTNARYLSKDSFDGRIDGVVADVSFISLRLIFPAISQILSDGGFAITLIKPQFECEHKNIGKSGIVHPSAHVEIVSKVVAFAKENGLQICDVVNAPVRKGKNLEYVALWKRGAAGLKSYEVVAKVKALTALFALDQLQ